MLRLVEPGDDPRVLSTDPDDFIRMPSTGPALLGLLGLAALSALSVRYITVPAWHHDGILPWYWDVIWLVVPWLFLIPLWGVWLRRQLRRPRIREAREAIASIGVGVPPQQWHVTDVSYPHVDPQPVRRLEVTVTAESPSGQRILATNRVPMRGRSTFDLCRIGAPVWIWQHPNGQIVAQVAWHTYDPTYSVADEPGPPTWEELHAGRSPDYFVTELSRLAAQYRAGLLRWLSLATVPLQFSDVDRAAVAGRPRNSLDRSRSRRWRGDTGPPGAPDISDFDDFERFVAPGNPALLGAVISVLAGLFFLVMGIVLFVYRPESYDADEGFFEVVSFVFRWYWVAPLGTAIWCLARVPVVYRNENRDHPMETRTSTRPRASAVSRSRRARPGSGSPTAPKAPCRLRSARQMRDRLGPADVRPAEDFFGPDAAGGYLIRQIWAPERFVMLIPDPPHSSEAWARLRIEGRGL